MINPNGFFVMVVWNYMNIPKYTLIEYISFKWRVEKDNDMSLNNTNLNFLSLGHLSMGFQPKTIFKNNIGLSKMHEYAMTSFR